MGRAKQGIRGGFVLEQIKDYWPIIAAFTASVIWAVRVEAGMKKNAQDIRGLWKQRNEDLEASKAARSETNAVLTRLEGKMDTAFKEFRDDIKTLLLHRNPDP